MIVLHDVGSSGSLNSGLITHGTSYALNVGQGHLGFFGERGFE